MNIIDAFKNSDGKAYRIWCDMDGVLVNWNKGYNKALAERDPETAKMLGYPLDGDPWELEDLLAAYYNAKEPNPKKAKSKAKARFWKIIQGDYEWWVNLEWMPDGKELFNYIHKLRNEGTIIELNILSSPSSDPVCEKGKRAWLEKQGIAKYFDNIVIFKEKYKMAKGPYDILIDDTEKKINEWNSISNGSGILHTSTADTIPKIEKIIRGNNDSQNDTSNI